MEDSTSSLAMKWRIPGALSRKHHVELNLVFSLTSHDAVAAGIKARGYMDQCTTVTDLKLSKCRNDYKRS